MKLIVSIIFILFNIVVLAQPYLLKGKITNKDYQALDNVNIFIKETPNVGTSTDIKGNFELKIKDAGTYTLKFSHLEYIDTTIIVNIPNITFLRLILQEKIENLPQLTVNANQNKENNIEKLNPKLVNIIPDASGGIEATLKTMPGVSKTNELSSQYSVRGGNFDENLVYVNQIEVYRPTLIRSGQQEGLSFVNPDMVSNIYFSAGGFDAKYGDKMSSVLDIQYKKPIQHGAHFTASLLGTSFTLENSSKNHRFTHISGFRYKTSQYLLNSLDTKGDYKPRFFDYQTYITYDINENNELSFLGNIAQNHYRFIPQTRETSFGTIDEALKLKIYFDGQESDKYTTSLGAISLTSRPSEKTKLSYTISVYYTDEQERYDILGQYFLNELDKQLGSNSMGDSLMNIGVGTFLNHARNYLTSTILSLQHTGSQKLDDNKIIIWGINGQHEKTNDNLHEWVMIDSAGYSIPYTDSIVGIYSLIYGKNQLQQTKASAFAQYSNKINFDSTSLSYTFGIRTTYSSYSDQILLSPRASFIFHPNWRRNINFKFSTGYYYQPLSYKEVRLINGAINYHLIAQQSIHFVLGSDYNFTAWNRSFRYISELFYKRYNHLIPYQIENVRIQYLGHNNAIGYAVGLDMKVNGEFVPGVESWVSLSLLKTQEDIIDDFYYKNIDGQFTRVEPGYIPRPTDQLINLGLFFQDYLPMDPTYTMQLSLLFGSGLPFGPPKSERYEATYRMPPYRRVDIGFSKILKSPEQEINYGILKYFDKLWIGLEVFNLLDIDNTISYQWVSDIRGHEYAVPNYLSSRRLNIKIIASF
ncbi:MAG: TonB-dependent receptor [Bacteroidales bacterium]|nr:TonB-dependent receptor [Bacteroidales bacterium]